MKKIIDEIVGIIDSQLISGTVNLVKLENFESPIIYMSVCKHFKSKNDIELVGNIETKKYYDFENSDRQDWSAALDYLRTNGFVNENVPLTKLRNDSVLKSGRTSLLLLMGAEAAVDKGSIKDFNSISMVDIIGRVKKDYSKWFKGYLMGIDADTKENREIINNIFRAVFQYNNVDAMKLSSFADSLYEKAPETFSELIEYIFNSLAEYWNMPSICSYIPKASQMKGKRSIKVIISAFEFINNKLNISSAKFKALPKKLEKYAEENSIDPDESFMAFASYNDFGAALVDFLKNREIEKNRAAFMKCDFGIINKILALKATSDDPVDPPEEKDSVVKLYGDPLDIYLQMILCSCIKFRGKYNNAMPSELELNVKDIYLSNTVVSNDIDDDEEDAVISQFRIICTFMGGLLNFINEKGLNEKALKFRYIDDIDPFDYTNLDVIKPKIKSIKKWGVNSYINFIMKVIGENGDEVKSYEFKWIFSPYANWKNAFLLLTNIYNTDPIKKTLPLLVCCKNTTDFLNCESESEFFVKLESIHIDVMDKAYTKLINSAFTGSDVLNKFNRVNLSFEKWCDCVIDNGFFNNIDKMSIMISDYTELLDLAKNMYNTYSANQKEKISLLLNAYTIISNEQILLDGHSSEVIVPSYNPAMLEKINAQCLYTIFSFSELFDDTENLTEKNYQGKLSDIKSMAEITQGVDLIPNGSGGSIVCKNVWGYYAVYYGEDTQISYISNVALVQDDVDEDETDKKADSSTQARVICRNVLDYIKTFPVRADGLNVCFIAPQEIEYVVAGIGQAAEELSKKGLEAVFNVRIICFGGAKNVSGYLRFWLNNYMSKERSVKINAYLKYIQTANIANALPQMLENQDLCFIYDILKTDSFRFEQYTVSSQSEQEMMKYCQFPMTFIPDTITGTHGRNRKVNISQTQFYVSKAYTQLAHKIIEPNAVDGNYKVMQQLSLENTQADILDIVHKKCRWVVCEDKAIDREILRTDDKKIIGFTTGEGCFGEYNVTVSAKSAILADIQRLLKARLVEKFGAWSSTMAEKAADNCLALTEAFDGSRILKALNPYDYEIHNFLAYALIVQELNICEPIEGKFISRNLLNLDSYRHWLKDSDDDKRPDFMLIELPIKEDTYDVNTPLKIRIKIIECKMGLHVDNYIDKAALQVNSGISTLSSLWTKDNKSVSRRYWFTQLYRAIAFSKLGINDSDEKYALVNSKIYGILNGDFEIEWSGDIYAYSLTDNNDKSEITELDGNDIVSAITLHKAGQLYIQKKLLPTELRDSKLVYSDIEKKGTGDVSENDEQETEAAVSYTIDEKNTVEQLTAETAKDETVHDEKKEGDPINNDDQNNAAANVIDSEKSASENENVTVPVCKNVSDVRILLGEDMRTKEKYYWEFGNKELNNRHLLINGNSGCGKTYCIQGLLMDTALQGVSSVVFDYTGGFVSTKLDPVFKTALGDKIKQRIIRKDKIPVNPFVKHDIQIDEDICIPEENVDVASKIAEIFSTVYSLGDQQKSAVYSAVLSGLDKYGDSMSFKAMVAELDEIGTSYAKTVISKIQAFTDINPFAVDNSFNWGDIRDSDGMVYVIQLIGYVRDIQILLTELLLWDIWSFSVKNGDESKPLILVLDEAQNLSHGDKSPSAKILTEGRKFGLSGWYATQFMKPQLSDDEIQRLQQAGQKLYFCPPDDGVMAVAKNIDISTQGAKDWSEKLKKLKKGECVTCGSMVRNGRWTKYEPKILKVVSLQERLENE